MADKISVTSQSPYFDDFDPTKDYVQVLFRPGFPVQARELTTLQSFLQEQVNRLGLSTFEPGTIVRQANISVTSNAYEMVLSGSGNTTYPALGAATSTVLAPIETFVGKIITDATGLVKARVMASPLGVDTSKNVGNIYLEYITETTFDADGYIYATTDDNPTQAQTYWNTFSTINTAVLAHIGDGTFFVEDRFIRVGEQTVLISNESQAASCQVGLVLSESAVTQNEDTSLFDNARGSTNEGAPGAHRLKYELTLATRDLDASADSTFYRVATFIDGVKQDAAGIDPAYQKLLDILARRTYDESGHYALRPFVPTVDTFDSEESFLVTVSPSKAYVKGYEVEKSSPTKLLVQKESGTKTTKNYKIPVAGTTYMEVTGVTGELPGNAANDPFDPNNRLRLRRANGDVIGVARGWAVLDEFKNNTAVTELYLYDVRMFTVVETTAALALSTGDDIYSVKTRGSVYDEENANTTLGANAFVVVGATGKFRLNQTIASEAAGVSSTISGITTWTIGDVATVTSSNTTDNFSATVVNSYGNENTSLFVETDAYIKTIKDDGGSNALDNDFEVFSRTAGVTDENAANLGYSSTRVDDGTEIVKTLKFAYMHIPVATGVGFGWSATHRDVSLYYPDIYKVYGVNETTDSTLDNGRFKRINVTTASTIAQGSKLVGETSGNEAIVALSNTSLNTANLSGFTSYSGTGSSTTLEIVFTKGSKFTVAENLRVYTPSDVADYTANCTFNSVTAETGFSVQSNFLLDDGQRNEYYDIGRLVRKETASAPRNDIVVFYSYFDADPTTNHFYSADSYSAERFYDVNPRLIGATREIGTQRGYEGKSLRNGIDFRLRVKPALVAGFNNSVSPFNFQYREFYNQSRVVPDTTFTTDLVEYFGRIDCVTLQKDGNFLILKGKPEFQPKKPTPSEEVMGLFYMHIDPVVYWPEKHVQIEKIDNRRYTMRDIGELDKRIDRVEEALSLTMLELQALNDDVDTRTKSGFTVDAFAKEIDETSAGDASHPEYRASIDVLNKQLIPAQTSGVPIDMTVSATVGTSTFFPGFLMKQFTEEAFSTQMRATTSQRVNPFATWIYNGDIQLSPSEDNWHARADSYFTSLYGVEKPYNGDSDAWVEFGTITAASPGGRSVVTKEWIGEEKSSSKRSGNKITTTKTRAQKTTTTSKFDTPRSTGDVTSTKTGSKLIQNLQDYWMRPMTVSYKANNLKPNTAHDVIFGGILVGEVTSDSSGKATGTFNIQTNTYRAGTETFSLLDQDSGFLSVGNTSFSSIGHLDTYKTVAKTVSEIIRSTSTATVTTGTSVKTVPSYRPSSSSSSSSSSSGSSSFNYYTASSSGGWSNPTRVSSSAGKSNPFSYGGYSSAGYSGGSPSSSCGWGDPLAQMFTLPMSTQTDRQTSVVTSLDLWFSFVDQRTNMNKVLVEIRESVNGYPGGEGLIVGTSGYVYINKSSETTSISDSTAVNFKFREPVVLKGGTEYAIVIKSPSDTMSVYIAEIGETLIDGSGVHDTQPNVGGYFGSLFTSQNATTWNAEQAKDLTYRLKRAKFSETAGTVTLKSTVTDTGYHKADIGAYNRGLALETFDGSSYVKVHHPNHGFHWDGPKVVISGVNTGTYNNIPSTSLNGEFDVLFPTLDSYFVDTGVEANGSSRINTGAFTTFATQDIMYDSIITNLMPLKTEADFINVSLDTVVTSSCNLVYNSTNSLVENSGILSPYADETVQVENGSPYDFDEPRIVRSSTNNDGTISNDLVMTVTLDSTNFYSSPIIKEGTNLNPIVFRNFTGNLLTDSDIEIMTQNDSEQKISYLSAVQSETEHSAYVTKEIDLDIPADGLTIKFSADMAPASSVEISYKALQIGDNTPFEELKWEDAPYTQQITEENYGAFSSSEEEEDYTVRINVPYDFSAFKVRIRLRTQNEAQVPKVKDLRIIADV